MQYSLEPIGIVHSCFKDKFGVPRQPGLIKEARAEIEFFPPYDRAEAFVGLEVFSHIWIQFLFHQCLESKPRLSVRPPRLGGNKKLGVFATRSTHRPNGIGMSVVALDSIVQREGKCYLKISDVDLIDGTPILDIKPYLPYSDSIPDARAGFAQEPPEVSLYVCFTEAAQQVCSEGERCHPGLQQLIRSVLMLDPRPAYMKSKGGNRDHFSIRLYNFDVHWRFIDENCAEVYEIVSL